MRRLIFIIIVSVTATLLGCYSKSDNKTIEKNDSTKTEIDSVKIINDTVDYRKYMFP